jgi:hypothetical protein
MPSEYSKRHGGPLGASIHSRQMLKSGAGALVWAMPSPRSLQAARQELQLRISPPLLPPRKDRPGDARIPENTANPTGRRRTGLRGHRLASCSGMKRLADTVALATPEIGAWLRPPHLPAANPATAKPRLQRGPGVPCPDASIRAVSEPAGLLPKRFRRPLTAPRPIRTPATRSFSRRDSPLTSATPHHTPNTRA